MNQAEIEKLSPEDLFKEIDHRRWQKGYSWSVVRTNLYVFLHMPPDQNFYTHVDMKKFPDSYSPYLRRLLTNWTR